MMIPKLWMGKQKTKDVKMNDNKNKINQNLWNISQTMIWWNFIAMYTQKRRKNLLFKIYVKKLEKN